MNPHPLVSSTEVVQSRPAASSPVRRRSRKAIFLTWLRKIHLYVGLWGAALGLLFGVTGFLLNHRAILKIPVEKAVQTSAQLAVPEGAFSTPKEMADWLQRRLDLRPAHEPVIRVQKETTVAWGDREVRQPERWTVNLQTPGRGVSAEYYAGNRTLKLDQQDATLIGFLTRLHTSTGASAFWVLLTDTIAGSLVLLSLTGLLLWTQLHTVRLAGLATSLGALALAAGYLLMA
jgi:hypothetical protein